jgi:hypothetical protein
LRHLFFASQRARVFLAGLWHLSCAHFHLVTRSSLLLHAPHSPDTNPFQSNQTSTITTKHPLSASLHGRTHTRAHTHTLSDGGFDQLTRRGLDQTAELAHALLHTVGAGGNETFATEIEVRCIDFRSLGDFRNRCCIYTACASSIGLSFPLSTMSANWWCFFNAFILFMFVSHEIFSCQKPKTINNTRFPLSLCRCAL